MKKWILFILLIPVSLYAQFTDDFNDGDFTNNPTWSGDAPVFTINPSLQLQLNNTIATSSQLTTPNVLTTLDEMEWQFYIKMPFAPSTANFAKVYLVSDKNDLKSPLNGYYLQFGEALSNDAVELFKQTGSTSTSVLRGTNAQIATSVNLKVKVTRTNTGLWTLYLDPTGGNNFQQQATGTETTYNSSSFFGILCTYTSGNVKNFFFDDFYIGTIINDTQPPSVTNTTAPSNDSLKVYFNEIVDQSSAELLSNYSVNNSIGSPQTAKLDVNDKKLVYLTFTNLFQNGTQNILTVNSVKDLAGNAMTTSQQISFSFFTFSTPVKNDVVINEIYPAPSSGNLNLPNLEFAELFNTSSNKVFNLNGWKFNDNSTSGTFPNIILLPGEYLIICTKADTNQFTPFGKVAGLSTWPSLNNDGDFLKLFTSTNTLINSVQYSDSWYKDVDKKSGGWSLEQINPLSPCTGANNWIASTDVTHGTPGKENSVYSNVPDTKPPTLTNVYIYSSTEIQLVFDEGIDVNSISSAIYNLNSNTITPVARLDSFNSNILVLTLSSPLTDNASYTIAVTNIRDCWGNLIAGNNSKVFIYYDFYPAKPGDIVINELMPDPDPPKELPNAEYIELYNRTNNAINLKGFTISDNTSKVTVSSGFIVPKGYAVLCNSSFVSEFGQINNVVGTSMSSSLLNNDGDLITLKNDSGIVISRIGYTKSWYGNPDKDDGGWSLEQIDPENPCSGASNWRASENATGGTPGSQNSVFANNPDTKPPTLTNVYIYSSTEIQLVFDEGIDAGSISSALYNLNSNSFTPVTKPDSINSNILILSLSSPLTDKTSYTITVTNIRDCWGNLIAGNNSKIFIYYDFYPAKPGDIVINELMPDPDPPKDLPNAEYIELYNRTNNAINLKGFTILDNTTKETTKKPISTGYIAPKGYAIVCNSSLVSQFGPVINVIGTSIPSDLLNNTGDLITLKNDSGIVISMIGYTISWYGNPSKDDGGWSLEQIDPENPCSRASNWRASENANGGTPGSQNSVFANNPDTKEPELIKVNTVSADTLQLIFSETMDSISLYLGKYFLNDTLSVFSKIPLSPDYTKVNLVLNKKIILKKNYTITINDVRDCSGNTIKNKNKAFFGLPEIADSSDLVLNEILFNPKTGGNDFVELYNRSDKFIDLRNWQLANKMKDTISDKIIISTDYYTIYPKQYVVVTTGKDVLKKFYPNSVDSVIIDVPSLPSYNDDKGIVIFLNPAGKLMERFNYSDKMHFALLRDKSGVSLERVSIDKSANEIGNWQSAAATSGYATPGSKNSQVGDRMSAEEFAVLPRVFTPDSDGKNDFATVIYNLDKPGYVGSLTIFDSMGRKIKKVAQNEYLGQSGNFSWDGTNEENLKARIGYYVVYFEVFDLNGKKKDYKETVVVGAKF